MAALRTAEIEALVTVNTDDVDRADKKIKATGERIEKKPLKVDADAKGALASMDRVETAAKRLVSETTALKLDADISRAEAGIQRTNQRLEDLRIRALGGLDVAADTKRAEAQLQKLERNLSGLIQAKNEIEVEADPKPAENALKRFLARFRSDTEEAGGAGGRSLVSGLDKASRGAGQKVGEVVGGDIEGTLVSALAAIPIAGGIILGAKAIGEAIVSNIQAGLAVEQRTDRLQALTGISPEAAARFARSSAEAYANVFGESIESNMNIARLGVQYKLIDPNATRRDAQQVIEGLAGISDVLEEDVGKTATAVTTLLQTGMAKSARDAFDLIATGARNGVNRGEDLLDTFTEYPSVLSRLGLSGAESLGLISQALDAGARNSDVAADALKEFQIRATDGSKASADGFRRLGLDADDMTAKIAKGGESARDGLQEVLDRLRDTEDPVKRNAAAVELFGTKAEDLGETLFAMDLSTAVKQLDGVTGSAQRMFDTLADNDATKLDQAKRNIDVAVEGIQGALAAAFADPLADAAQFITENRGAVLQFFSDMINGAIDFGIAASTSFGEFVSGPLADTIEGLAGVIDVMNGMEGRPKELDNLADSMRGFDKTTDDVNTRLEEMRGQFNGFMDAQVQMGHLNDASHLLAGAIDEVGGKTGDMESQVRGAIAALGDEIAAADAAGESQSELAGRYEAGRKALEDQMVQSGMSRDAARKLIETIQETPESKSTKYSSNVRDEMGKVSDLAGRVTQLPDGSFYVQGKTDDAYSRLMSLQAAIRQVTGNHSFRIAMGPGGQGGITQHDGGLVEFYANGGLRGLTPMAPVAQKVPANTWRVVGDRGDVPEAYIPLDGSARSLAILAETMAHMGVGVPTVGTPAVTGAPSRQAQFFDHSTYVAYDVEKLHRDKQQKMRKMLGDAGLTDT